MNKPAHAFRFSLRVLLAGVAVVAVGLAIWTALPAWLANLLMFGVTLLTGSVLVVAVWFGSGSVRTFAIGAIPPIAVAIVKLMEAVDDLPLTLHQLQFVSSGAPPDPDPFGSYLQWSLYYRLAIVMHALAIISGFACTVVGWKIRKAESRTLE